MQRAIPLMLPTKAPRRGVCVLVELKRVAMSMPLRAPATPPMNRLRMVALKSRGG